MKRIVFTFFSLFFLWVCNTSKNSTNITSEPFFKVQIEQEGKIILPVNNIITLKKNSFKFKLEIKGIEGVYLSTTWDDHMYNFPKNKNIFFCDDEGTYENCGFLSPQTMASENFNSDKSLTITDKDYQHYWFYSDEYDWHRLDKGVEVKNGAIFASYTVDNIFDILSKIEYPVSKIKKDIFVVVAAELEDKVKKSHKELQREKFILKFE